MQWHRVDAPVQGWYRYMIDTVLSSREYVHLTGTYSRVSNGGAGGSGQIPRFDVDVPGVDLDIDGVAEEDEENGGGYAGVVSGLCRITLRKVQPEDHFMGVKNVVLRKDEGGNKVRIWTSPAKTSQVCANGPYTNAVALPRDLYVEGADASAALRDVKLTIAYTVKEPNTGELKTTEDYVKFTVLKVELKVTHPQNPGPTGSAAKYTNTPNPGSADNLFSTWLNEQFRVNVNIQPAELANNLPAGFIKWTAAGFTIPDNTTEYTFSWGSTGAKEITVEFPSCGITKKIRVDVPDVGSLSQTEAAAAVAVVSPVAAALIATYAQEAVDYSNNNFPVGPQRDAFRHSYWNALCVSHIGIYEWESLLVSTGHEHDNRDNDHQQGFNSTMDLHNNAVGVTINHTTLLGTPDRTPIQITLPSNTRMAAFTSGQAGARRRTVKAFW